jgi:hypothetical protein
VKGLGRGHVNRIKKMVLNAVKEDKKDIISV